MLRAIVALGVVATSFLFGSFGGSRPVFAAPANDQLAGAIAVGSLPFANVQDTTTATLEAGEPQPPASCATAAIGNTIWYSFTAPASARYQVDTIGSNYDTIVAVFTGSSFPLSPVVENAVAVCNDETTSGTQSRLQFNASAGVTYRIQVGGFDSDSGITLTNVFAVPPAPANDAFANAASVGAPPFTNARTTHAAAVNEAGEPQVCGAAGKTVWYRFIPSSNGQRQIDTIGSNFDTVLSVFTGTALNNLVMVPNGCNDDFQFPSRQSKVTVDLVAGVSYWIQAGGFSPQELETDFGDLVLHVQGATDDSDGDGCTDAQEDGDDENFGGDRDAADPWDFFDANGDRAIDIEDALVVLGHFGHGPNDDATDDLVDRWSPDPAKPYRTAEAPGQHGGVDLSDAIVNLQSFGHTCDVG